MNMMPRVSLKADIAVYRLMEQNGIRFQAMMAYPIARARKQKPRIDMLLWGNTVSPNKAQEKPNIMVAIKTIGIIDRATLNMKQKLK